MEPERRAKGWRVLGRLAGAAWGISFAVGVWGLWVWGSTFTCSSADDALAALRVMEQVELHALRRRSLPTTLGEVVHPVPRDRYGNPWVYRRLGEASFEVRSWGADGRPSTPDDVVAMAQ